MAKLIRCECGFVARGESDDQVVGVIRGHMASDHPALLDTVSREDLLSWVQAESLRPDRRRRDLRPAGWPRSAGSPMGARRGYRGFGPTRPMIRRTPGPGHARAGG
jgi:predicted small metal-binding protein